MQSEQLQKFRSKIEHQLSEIEIQTSGLRQALLDTSMTRPPVSIDSLDHAKDEHDLNTLIEIHEKRMKLRDQLRLALRLVKNESYGQCQGCDEEIDLRRLEIQHAAGFCIRCQKTEDKREVIRIEPDLWISANRFWGAPLSGNVA